MQDDSMNEKIKEKIDSRLGDSALIPIWNRKIRLRTEAFSGLLDNREIAAAVKLMATSLEAGHKILIFGNGGSATQSSHFAAELVNRFYFDRPALPAVALTADSANLTCIANDSDYRYVFSRQVEALGNPGDTVIGITTGGSSANVLEALERAKKMKLHTVALCGNRTGALQKVNPDIIVRVNEPDTPVIQECHLFILHFMAEMLEQYFFSDQDKRPDERQS